jgi:hypothetical protein
MMVTQTLITCQNLACFNTGAIPGMIGGMFKVDMEGLIIASDGTVTGSFSRWDVWHNGGKLQIICTYCQTSQIIEWSGTNGHTGP